jgi:ACS family tartrate transporter-like MFS transporter
MATSPALPGPLDRARAKAYVRLLPILLFSYVIAYIDRVNISVAKLGMQKDPDFAGFSESAFGFGMGVFFVGYLILEIPGSLIVERWSARKWISRIMVSWGLVASLTAFVHCRVPGITWLAELTVGGLATILGPLGQANLGWVSDQAGSAVEALREPASPFVLQFFSVRFLLGLAEAGFYPGVIVYLTHWFPRRDRTKTLAWFFIGTPLAQIVAPKASAWLLGIGANGSAPFLGLVGWQWVFIVWGLPAVIVGIVILFYLTDRPHQAKWLTVEEREALEEVLAREKREQQTTSTHMTVAQALTNPKVLALAAAYFFVVTGSYGVEFYMASIVENWYHINISQIAALIIIPPIGALISQVLVGWNSDRTQERKWHSSLPIVMGAVALLFVPATEGRLWLTITLFTFALVGMKAYLPAFWALPNLFLTESAAAASIGLINSCGNLGGLFGPSILGIVKQATGAYNYGLWTLSGSVFASAMIIVSLRLGGTTRTGRLAELERNSGGTSEPAPDAVVNPV